MSEAESWRAHRQARLALVGVLAGFLALVLAIGWFDFQARRRAMLDHELFQISSLAQEKAQLLELWRRERAANVAVAALDLGNEWPADASGRIGGFGKAMLVQNLAIRCATYGYRQAQILTPDGEIAASVEAAGEAPPEPIPPELSQRIRGTKAPFLLDLFGPEGRTLLAVAPIAPRGIERPLGYLVYLLDASSQLDPLLLPVDSTSRGHSVLLARAQGDRREVLAPWPGKEPGSFESLRIEAPATLPVGLRGVAEQRGPGSEHHWIVERPVRDSDWRAVARLERAWLERELRSLGIRHATGYAILLLALWSTALLFWTRWSRALERRERSSAEVFREFFEQAADGIFVTDAELLILDANPAACRLIGFAREELLGRSATRLILPEELAAQPLRTDRIDEGPLRRERTIVHRDGHPVTVEVGAQRLSDSRILGFVRDVSERRRSEEWLRLLSRALDESPAAEVITDRQGRIEYVNQRFAEITGWSAREVIGQTPKVLASGHTPEEVYRELWATILAGREWRGELVNRRKNGELYHWSLHIQPMLDENGEVHRLIGVGEDVSEQRRYRERFRLARKLARMGVWELDTLKQELWWSVETYEIFGAPAETFRPSLEGFVAMVHAEDRERVRAALDRAVRGVESMDLEYRFVRRDGEQRWARTVCDVVHDGMSRPLSVLGVVLDITEQHGYEAALSAAREQLLHSQKMDALGRLAGGVAHDFNNLLSIVLGYAELLSPRFAEGSEERQQVDEVRAAVGRASDLTRQLLAFSRRQVLDLRVVEPGEILQQTQRLLRRVMPENIEFSLDRPPELWRVRADPTQLVQVLINLAVNARDAMPAGGRLEIVARNERLAGKERAEQKLPPGDYLRLEVRDSGAGMTPEVASRVFEPFFTTKGDQGGTGLGLATVYGIVQQLGGDIRIESVAGTGTTFVLLLPRARREESGEIELAPPPLAPSTGTVLVVEDMAPLRKMLCRMLEDLGFDVLTAESADQALVRSREHAGAIDVLLSDIVMPGMDGRELARLLKAERTDLRIILMSGYSELLAEAGSAAELGADAVLQKPFASAQIRRTLGEVMARRRDPPGA